MKAQQYPGAESDPTNLARRIEDLYAKLRIADPNKLAKNTGATYVAVDDGHGEFLLSLWSQEIRFSFPDFQGSDLRTGQPLGLLDEAMLAYYFTISDGTLPEGQWIAFSELPDGNFYAQAFQGYTGNKLLKTFGEDIESFSRAAVETNGRRVNFADRAFVFQALPQVSLMAVCWQGDEDFPPSYRLLFDGAASHHLSTDACAILGSTLTTRLVKAHDQATGVSVDTQPDHSR
jgi:hypothetical protein